MKNVAGFHSLDLGDLFFLEDEGSSRFRMNLGIMEVQTEVFVTRGIELDGRVGIALLWESGGGWRSRVSGREVERVSWLESLVIFNLEAIFLL